MARLLGIAVKQQRKGAVSLHSEAMITRRSGVVGDWRGKPGKRQVTLMSLADWQAACAELGVELPWQTRRANLLVDELPLYQSTGSRILLGEGVLEVTGETDPCERMEQAQPGLFQALATGWRGGVTCRVVADGVVRTGMAVSLIRPESP
ncbi:MAG: MOSC domain-containing protein [Pseudomonadota bacterium]